MKIDWAIVLWIIAVVAAIVYQYGENINNYLENNFNLEIQDVVNYENIKDTFSNDETQYSNYNQIDSSTSFEDKTSNKYCLDGYFYNYVESRFSPNVKSCQKINYNIAHIEGKTYYYNTSEDLKSWCREAREGAPEDTPGNCNWGYLSWDGANNWCAAVQGRLLSKEEMANIWKDFMSYNPPMGQNPCYWTSTKGEPGTFWCYGKNAGGNTRKDGYWGAGAVICLIE